MRELVFFRHAATDQAGRFCGHSDPPVNEEGARQIRMLLQGLPIGYFDAIASSDLERARTTAQAIAGREGLIVTPLSDLREIHFGEWEGMTWQQIEAQDAAYAARWLAEFPNLPAPSGERFAAFKSRVLRVVASLADEGAGRCAVVTHGGVMRVVLNDLCHIDAQETWKHTKDFCSSFVYIPEQSAAVIR